MAIKMQAPFIDAEGLFRIVQFFDILAAIVFAVSGSLVASRKNMDVMGFMWFAVITGVGGGTVRDLILGVPVFWVQHPAHVAACVVTAVVMHFVAPRVESRSRAMDGRAERSLADRDSTDWFPAPMTSPHCQS